MSAATLIRDWKTPMLGPNTPVERISVRQYEAMIAAGILTENSNVELLDGFMVRKMSKGDHHDSSIDELYGVLFGTIARSVTLRCQNVLVLANSEPEPDFVLCKSTAERKARHPRPKDTYLVIEVADTTLATDRGVKLRLYAEAGIPCYGVVNLIARQIEVYSDPDIAGRKYRSRVDYKRGREVPIVIRKETVGSIPVDAAFPFAKKKS